jgi:hypothetical protein
MPQLQRLHSVAQVQVQVPVQDSARVMAQAPG